MKLRYVIAAALGLALVSTGPAALAGPIGHATKHDPKRDAPKGIDITRVSVRADSETIRATIHVRDLRRKRDVHFELWGSYFKERDLGPGWFSDDVTSTWIDKHGHARAHIEFGEDGFFARCSGLRARWNTHKDTVTIVTPARCGGADWHGKRFAARSAAHGHHDHVKMFKLH